MTYSKEPVTGYRYSLFADAPHLLDDTGALDLGLFPGCDRYNMSSLAAELTGWKDAHRIAALMEGDPSYPFIRGRDGHGHTVIFGTCVASAQAWFDSYLTASRARQQANLWSGRSAPSGARTVVSS